MITHLEGVSPAELDLHLSSASAQLSIVYLWGADCPNCLIFKRSLPKLLDRLSDIDAQLLEVDVYAHPQIATRYGVMGIPHFLLFKSGKKLGKMSEFKGDGYWMSVVREHSL